MSRRALTVALTSVLLVALVSVAWMLPVPYVAMSPGPVEDVLGKEGDRPVIEVAGYEQHETTGRLDLTTVSATPASRQLGLVEALRGWIDSEVAVVPRDYLYPEDQTPEQVDEVNAELMDASQHHAVAAALRLAGKDVNRAVAVGAVLEGAPAQDRLKAGDLITAVDGKPMKGPSDVQRAVGDAGPGAEVEFTVQRGAKTREVTVTTEKSEDEPETGVVGIQVETGYDYNGEVTINISDQIGGPSAGAMFALGLYDKLVDEDLLEGEHVAGTGSIDADGKVGPIGGIQQKVAGAKAAGATVFLVPSDNCEAAAALGADGIRLIEVGTLQGAVRALENLREGNAAKVPTCDASS